MCRCVWVSMGMCGYMWICLGRVSYMGGVSLWVVDDCRFKWGCVSDVRRFMGS